ncbi:MAG: hypothetical protein EPN36_14440 [Rhodanobacteraceae bacterium]|nr:MAG: hypothetical protein EPN36_14440 [Rhodanobacteraceae bacterium]
METDKLFFVGAGAIDVVYQRDDGTLAGGYSGKTQAQLVEEYGPELRVGTREEFRAAHDAHWRAPFKEITAEAYDKALNVLPPSGWHTTDGVESFKWSERLSGTITNVFARTRDRFFTCRDDISLSPAVIASRVHALLATQGSPRAA